MFALQAAFAGTTIVPTTTLSAETGNNTSAANSFVTQTNGNIGAGNVSKVPFSNLLYSGSTAKVYVHFMPWFGTSSHMNVGYTSNDPTQVKAQVGDMLSRGISGAVIDWYGPNGTLEESTSQVMKTEAESRNGQFEFAITEDKGALSSCANTSGCDVTQNLINDLNYIYTNYESSPAYMRWNGNPVVFFFAVTEYTIDWTRVRANVQGNPIFIFQNSGGFTKAQSGGGFSWVEPETVTSTDPIGKSYLDGFYSTAQQYPNELPFATGYKGFNDSLAGWSSKRYMSQQCGQTWLQSIADIGSHYSSSNPLAKVQLVTWNDYEEGTEIETGIDNCVSVQAGIANSTLSWSITGNQNTLDHYTVFISNDGQKLMPLGDYPVSASQLDLSQFGFAAGSYTVYVKAVGQPSFVNHISAAAAYTAVVSGPVVALSATPTSGVVPVSVTASTSGSTDATGTIASSAIDFGDGTVVSGASASHTYASAGTYTLKATLTDSAGLSASHSLQISMAAPQPPVVQLSVSPASGTAPVTVTASTASSTDPQGSALSSSINFGDGTTAAGPTASHTYSNPGAYTVTATMTDALKLQAQAVAQVSVSAPAAVLVSQPANDATVASPIPVVASGTAPSGVAAMQIYLDGALVYQVNAASFNTTLPASAGAHRLTVKLWDNLGSPASQTVNVTVAAPLATSLSVTPAAISAGASVTATVTATSGTMASSQISWGDGASSTGPSASHIYASAGTYTATSTATSNVGTTSQASASVTVAAPTGSVTVSQPVNNASVHSPIPVMASGSASSGVDAMQIYLDGALVYQVNASSFNTTFSASVGTHQIVVKLWDKLGNAYRQSMSVNVVPALVTSLSLDSSTISAGGSVTAALSATSGTISSSAIYWGDGSSSSGPSATHTYTSAGAYTVTGTASDVAGPAQPVTAGLTVEPKATVVVQSPVANSAVPESLQVQGYASSPIGITAMQIYLDGVLVYKNSLSQVNTSIQLSAGAHRVTLKAWDTAGFSSMQAVYVTAQ